MKLEYRPFADGPGPSEAIVEVVATDGIEEVIVDRTLLTSELPQVGDAISRRTGRTLVELPREPVSGRTRVRVPANTARQSTAA